MFFLTVIDFNDDAPNCGVQSEVEISVSGLDSVFFIVEGWGNQSGDYTIVIGEGTLNANEIINTAFEFYPNPASNEITIISEQFEEVEIVSLNGQSISKHNISIEPKINIGHLLPGSYLIRAVNSESTRIEKFMKL